MVVCLPDGPNDAPAGPFPFFVPCMLPLEELLLVLELSLSLLLGGLGAFQPPLGILEEAFNVEEAPFCDTDTAASDIFGVESSGSAHLESSGARGRCSSMRLATKFDNMLILHILKFFNGVRVFFSLWE